MFDRTEIAEQVYVGQAPSKKKLGQIPTMTVMSGNKREDKPPRLPTLRRAALASARKNIQAIQVMGLPVQKINACYIAPDTTQKIYSKK